MSVKNNLRERNPKKEEIFNLLDSLTPTNPENSFNNHFQEILKAYNYKHHAKEHTDNLRYNDATIKCLISATHIENDDQEEYSITISNLTIMGLIEGVFLGIFVSQLGDFLKLKAFASNNQKLFTTLSLGAIGSVYEIITHNNAIETNDFYEKALICKTSHQAEISGEIVEYT